MNLFLIGYRATGKTAVGRALAQHLGWHFVDMDDTITAEAGASIAEMVQKHGWNHFREQERTLLKRLTSGRRQVVSTGGGVILLPDNVTTLRSAGTVIWLRAGADTIRRRLTRDERSAAFRPALSDLDPAAEIDAALAARTPLYQSAMDLVIDTENRTVEYLCAQIIDQLDRHDFDRQA
jgi:shikimate kinase